MRKELMRHIKFLAEVDERVWLLTADLGHGVLDEFAEAFPDRFLNVGIAEQNMMGIAAGLARCGKIPFVYSMSNFVTMRCYEQLRNNISYSLQPVRIISVGGGYTYGAAGYTHHGIEDLSVVRSLPYMSIWLPTTQQELWECAQFSMDNLSYPMYIRLARECYEPIEARTLTRERVCSYHDHDVVILSYGDGYKTAQKVAEELEEQGVHAFIETAVRLRPFFRRELFDCETPLVIIEEHSDFGGLASEYLDSMSSHGGKCLVFGIPPQHQAGTSEEMLGDIFKPVEMAADIVDWMGRDDSGQ